MLCQIQDMVTEFKLILTTNHVLFGSQSDTIYSQGIGREHTA